MSWNERTLIVTQSNGWLFKLCCLLQPRLDYMVQKIWNRIAQHFEPIKQFCPESRVQVRKNKPRDKPLEVRTIREFLCAVGEARARKRFPYNCIAERLSKRQIRWR